MKRLAILGSTGSIGCQTLEVVRRFPDRFSVSALSCGKRTEELYEQILEFRPKIVSVLDQEDAHRLQRRLDIDGISCIVMHGIQGNNLCASYDEVSVVVAAMVGVCGLEPVVTAIHARKDIALANKETLVAAGAIVMPLAKEKGVKILPVDSEHSAIWQCLWGQPEKSLDKILLTASGGPFRGFTKDALENVTLEQALHHPTWSMGGKITIDSATMMNKGLEVMEASWLFDIPVDQISVVVHPQSIIHSMVGLKDGSILAQMGRPSMILPIQIALCYPERINRIMDAFDPFDKASSDLHFEKCDTEVFPCLALGYRAGRTGMSLPAVMNSANEEAVAAFLHQKIAFSQIPKCIEACMNEHEKIGLEPIISIDDIYRLDEWARGFVSTYLQQRQ